MPIRPRLAAALLAAGTLIGCATPPRGPGEFAGADVVMLGEQHDDPAHHRRHREVVQDLAARGRLAGLALEMAEQGRSTTGLPAGADEAAVRTALRWQDDAWPWAAYGPAVMAAVRAGAPVLGANLPREQVRAAMADAQLDTTLDVQALAAQHVAIRAGHCDLLPPQQIVPMVRVQIARDRAMAATVAGAVVAGRTVVLLAGAGHVLPSVGVPRHLAPGLAVRPLLLPPSGCAPARDHCEALRQQLRPAR